MAPRTTTKRKTSNELMIGSPAFPNFMPEETKVKIWRGTMEKFTKNPESLDRKEQKILTDSPLGETYSHAVFMIDPNAGFSNEHRF